MEQSLSLETVKLKLATYAALRPDAWDQISMQLKVVALNVDESFNRENGSIAYVVSGLIKEYDAQARKKPTIVNFISCNNFIITTGYNQSRYLKAITHTTIAYLNFDDLLSLFLTFRELKPIYDAAQANYEERLSFRYSLLEERLAVNRMQHFITHHRTILAHLKKKDIANYCHIPYDNFVRHYNNLL